MLNFTSLDDFVSDFELNRFQHDFHRNEGNWTQQQPQGAVDPHRLTGSAATQMPELLIGTDLPPMGKTLYIIYIYIYVILYYIL